MEAGGAMAGEAITFFCALSTASSSGTALAGEKPLLSALTTASGISATIEFGPPSIPSAVECDIPKRRVTVDERIAA
jgi:hypothetical protein